MANLFLFPKAKITMVRYKNFDENIFKKALFLNANDEKIIFYFLNEEEANDCCKVINV